MKKRVLIYKPKSHSDLILKFAITSLLFVVGLGSIMFLVLSTQDIRQQASGSRYPYLFQTCNSNNDCSAGLSCMGGVCTCTGGPCATTKVTPIPTTPVPKPTVQPTRVPWRFKDIKIYVDPRLPTQPPLILPSIYPTDRPDAKDCKTRFDCPDPDNDICEFGKCRLGKGG